MYYLVNAVFMRARLCDVSGRDGMLSSIILIIFPASPVPADLSIDCRQMCWPGNKPGNLIGSPAVGSGFCTARPWFDGLSGIMLSGHQRGYRCLTGSCHEDRYSMPPTYLRARDPVDIAPKYPARRSGNDRGAGMFDPLNVRME
ncbi:MAG TPA: hypothetical protein VM659_08195 [Dongiaceae bacterium]|nr:hypothetical protein [Dongiaceae bacterium]